MTNTKSCLENVNYNIFPKFDFGVNVHSPFTQKNLYSQRITQHSVYKAYVYCCTLCTLIVIKCHTGQDS